MSSRPGPDRADEAQTATADERFGLLMSIRPKFAEAILSGAKTVELRRRPPRDQPTVVLIYGSGAIGAVLGVAQLKDIHTSTPNEIWRQFGGFAGVSRAEFNAYFAGSETASALELTDVRRSDADVPLTSLREFGLEPPQSWRYVERQKALKLLDALGLEPVRPRVQRPRSLSGALAVPITLVEKGLDMATTRSNRSVLQLRAR